jgi:hypothetical protein
VRFSADPLADFSADFSADPSTDPSIRTTQGGGRRTACEIDRRAVILGRP